MTTIRDAAAKAKAISQAYGRGPTKAEIVEQAVALWRASYEHVGSDHEAAKARLDHLLGRQADHLGDLPGVQVQAHVYAQWAQAGLRAITMGHKIAASLMCTRISADALETLLPPWPAFMIDIPQGLLFTRDSTRVVELASVAVMHYRWHDGSMRWAYVAHARESSVTLWRFGLPGSSLTTPLDMEIDQALPAIAESSEPLDELDDRCTLMLGRLITGACLAMSQPENVKAPQERAPKEQGNRREAPEPRTRNYVLRYPVSVDCREAVHAYVQGTRARGPLSVQTLIAGHMRWQAHGPKGGLRKLIRVEPYWRGPENAPISASARKIR